MVTSSEKISKNGHDHIQDRDIRELRAYLSEYKDSNDSQHQSIIAMVSSIQGDVKAASWIGKILWGFAFVFMTTLGGFLGWSANQLSIMSDDISEVKAFSLSHVNKSDVIVEGLSKEIEHNEKELVLLKQEVKDLLLLYQSSKDNK
jgi:hypothetical protein